MARAQEELTIREVCDGFVRQKEKMVWIVAAGLILGVLLAVCFLIKGEINRQYCATASIVLSAKTSKDIYIVGKDGPAIDDITVSKELISTAEFIVKSEKTYLKIAENLKADFTYADYKKAVSLSQYNTTQILILRVTCADKQEAVLIANEITKVLPGVLQESMDIGGINTIDVPVSAVPISNTSFLLLVMIGFLAGAVAAFTWAIVYTITHPTIMSSSDIRERLNSNVMAEIFHQNVKEKQDFRSVRKGKAPGSFMENYGTLAAVFKSVTAKKNAKCVMITSALEGEGKSTVALNLAHAMLANGYRVLIIDCDTKRPVIGKALTIDNDEDRTLNGVIEHKIPLHEAVIALESGLHVVQSISTDTLLITGELNAQINAIRETYDYIFIDTPPAGIFPDVLNLAGCIDGGILVIRQSYASTGFIDQIMTDLQNADIRILGSVLNDVWQGKHHKAYYIRYYRKSYGIYDSQDTVINEENDSFNM